jgi:hypothetical protein
MFRGSGISVVKTVVLGVALLAYPCGMLAQRGPGGGSTGGGTAGGGGLSGPTGRATGLSEKDDLKNFHAALAVQATSQQIIEYAAMLKTTAAVSAQLQAFLGQFGEQNVPQENARKQNKGLELASQDATLDLAIEKARSETRKFLEGFSERQKSGLRELAKKIGRADADLAQQAKALDQEVGDAKAVPQSIASSAQSLDRALASFRSLQLDLGSEMSIAAARSGQDAAFNLLPVKNAVSFDRQSIAIVSAGVISKGVADGEQNTFRFALTSDLSDLQQNIREVLRDELNKSDRCGERIEIRDATLTPRAAVGLVVAHLHYERWACPTMFGRETMNELVEGNATIEVKLTPAVADDGTLRLVPETAHIDAEGLVGESLRSGSLGDALRDKITEALLSIVRQGADFKATLPPAAQGYTVLHRAEFQGTGSGKLMFLLDGEIRVSNEKVTALTSELKERSSAPEAVPR